jgi:type IV pilus assembly protein PilF
MRRKTIFVLIFSLACSSCAKLSEPQVADTVIGKERNAREKAAIINAELGLGYLAQGETARAKAKLIYALKLAPRIPETHSAMAYFSEKVSDTKEAELQHKMAIQLASSKGAIYNNYGAFLCRQNRYLEAEQAFQLALQDKEYPRTAEIYENAGLCALKSGHHTKAAHYFALSAKRDPNRVSPKVEAESL